MKLAICCAAAAALAALANSTPVLSVSDSNLYADQDMLQTDSTGSQFFPVDHKPDGLPSLDAVRFMHKQSYGISRLRATMSS